MPATAGAGEPRRSCCHHEKLTISSRRDNNERSQAPKERNLTALTRMSHPKTRQIRVPFLVINSRDDGVLVLENATLGRLAALDNNPSVVRVARNNKGF